jgi:anti-sigma B factor antagonist
MIAAQGEIDLSTIEDLEREIVAATFGEGASILLDLGEVTFLDSAGINVLLKGRRLADEHSKQFRVTAAHGLVRQVLEITGVWDHLSGEDR